MSKKITYQLFEVPNGRLHEFVTHGYTGQGWYDACNQIGLDMTAEELREELHHQIDFAWERGETHPRQEDLSVALFDAACSVGLSEDEANDAASAGCDAILASWKRDATADDDPKNWYFELADLKHLAVKKIEEDLGHLHTCDRDGNNCEPLNSSDRPYTFEDAEMCESGDPEVTIREATAGDDCAAEVTHVAENDDGEIVGYYRFISD